MYSLWLQPPQTLYHFCLFEPFQPPYFSSHLAHVPRALFIPPSAESAVDKAIDLTNAPFASTFIVLKDFSFMNQEVETDIRHVVNAA